MPDSIKGLTNIKKYRRAEFSSFKGFVYNVHYSMTLLMVFPICELVVRKQINVGTIANSFSNALDMVGRKAMNA